MFAILNVSVYILQFIGIILGVVFLKPDNNYNQQRLMNIAGVIFIITVEMSATTMFSLLNVSLQISVIYNCEE